jgi:hypothetical protein
MHREELDHIFEVLKGEDRSLVKLGLNQCIIDFGQKEWECMFSGHQIAYVETWIAGYKYGQEKLPSIGQHRKIM